MDGGGITNCTFREFVAGGLCLFGGMFILVGSVMTLSSIWFILDFAWASFDPTHNAITFAVGDSPVTVFEFISYSLPLGIATLVPGVLMVRFSFSRLMDALED